MRSGAMIHACVILGAVAALAPACRRSEPPASAAPDVASAVSLEPAPDPCAVALDRVCAEAGEAACARARAEWSRAALPGGEGRETCAAIAGDPALRAALVRGWAEGPAAASDTPCQQLADRACAKAPGICADLRRRLAERATDAAAGTECAATLAAEGELEELLGRLELADIRRGAEKAPADDTP